MYGLKFSELLDNILDNMTIEILLRMTSLIRHFKYYHMAKNRKRSIF